jgi:hypothetical protein
LKYHYIIFNVDTTFTFEELNATNESISFEPLTDAVYALPDGCCTFELKVIVEPVVANKLNVDVLPPLKLLTSILIGDTLAVNTK